MYSYGCNDLDTRIEIYASTRSNHESTCRGMTQLSSIEKRVKAVVAKQLAVEESHLRNDDTFPGDLGTDSLDMYELVTELEEEFKIEILDEQAVKILSVQDAIDLIMTQT